MSQPWSPSGYIPRDFQSFPAGTYGSTDDQWYGEDWLYPESEWEERFKEQQALQSGLLHLRERYYDVLKSLNQTNHPLCWAFSTTKAAMYAMAKMGMPEILSPWWTAGVSNGWRNQGGWGAQSTKGLAGVGGVLMDACPDFSSRFDTAETRALAGKRRVIEWYDGGDNREKNRAILVTSFLRGLAPVCDSNDIGHSMCGAGLISINPLVWYEDNSWGAIDQYGPKGLWKRNRIPDGIIVPRVINPAD